LALSRSIIFSHTHSWYWVFTHIEYSGGALTSAKGGGTSFFSSSTVSGAASGSIIQSSYGGAVSGFLNQSSEGSLLFFGSAGLFRFLKAILNWARSSFGPFPFGK
jgi:hypothetical protein